MVFVGTHLNQIEAVALIVGDGVSADQLQLGAQAAVNGVVVGTELDHGFLARMQECNVLRADLGFDQQVVFQRHDFHHVAARLDHAANSVDLQYLDDAFYGRGHRGARYAVVDGDARCRDFRQVGTFFIQLFGRVRTEGLFRFVDLAPDLGNRRFRPGNRQGGGVQRATDFHGTALEPQDLHRRNRAGLDQWLRHVHLLVDQRQTGTVLPGFRAEFRQFLGFLPQLF
ncbi:hypothetical protein D3C73_768340 [compost metagenome]